MPHDCVVSPAGGRRFSYGKNERVFALRRGVGNNAACDSYTSSLPLAELPLKGKVASETSRMRCSRRSGVILSRSFRRSETAKATHKPTQRQSGRQRLPGLQSKLKKGLEAEGELARKSDSKPFFNQTAATLSQPITMPDWFLWYFL